MDVLLKSKSNVEEIKSKIKNLADGIYNYSLASATGAQYFDFSFSDELIYSLVLLAQKDYIKYDNSYPQMDENRYKFTQRVKPLILNLDPSDMILWKILVEIQMSKIWQNSVSKLLTATKNFEKMRMVSEHNLSNRKFLDTNSIYKRTMDAHLDVIINLLDKFT